ncbi:MCE family protein [Nocardia arizonensis]|uniref:MCE family protein n=1 Tax=Nocardia arizonensis TaxID=1141647 RepID=UPI0006D155ED|nr:MCE family protein [Nocardia arizonensis]
MSYRKPLIGFSVFLAVAVAIIWSTFVTLARGVDGATNSYSAIFTDVSGLKVGDDVRMAGVRVGRVDKMELVGTQAKVTFRVERDQKLYGNTKASITYQNIIGQRYLGLALGKVGDNGPLADKAVIGVDRTEPSFDISGLLNGFEPLFSGLDPEQVDNLTGALVRALQGDSGAVVTLIAETSTLAQSLAGPDQVLGTVITNLDTVVRNLAAHSGDLETVLTQSRAVITGLAERRDALLDSLTQISQTAGRLNSIITAITPQMTEMMSRQPGFTQHFLDNKENFAYLGFNLPALLKGLARVSQEGTYISAYACDFRITLLPSLTALIPTIVDSATPGGAAQHSPICR